MENECVSRDSGFSEKERQEVARQERVRRSEFEVSNKQNEERLCYANNQPKSDRGDGKRRLVYTTATTRHDTRKTEEKKRETAVTVEKIYEESDRGTLGEQGNSGQAKRKGLTVVSSA